MQWWNDFLDWFTSTDARTVIFTGAVLFVAIIVAGLLAAWIARGSVRGLLQRTDRAQKASAIAALVDAATEASVWNSLTPGEQVLSDRAVGQADIMVRLLPIKGAGVAANWASHQLAEMKRNSATFGYQLDPAIAEFRDRLIEWQNKPGRAHKIFQSDLERWRFETSPSEQSLLDEQDAWVAQQHHDQYASRVEPAITRTTADEPATGRTTAEQPTTDRTTAEQPAEGTASAAVARAATLTLDDETRPVRVTRPTTDGSAETSRD